MLTLVNVRSHIRCSEVNRKSLSSLQQYKVKLFHLVLDANFPSSNIYVLILATVDIRVVLSCPPYASVATPIRLPAFTVYNNNRCIFTT